MLYTANAYSGEGEMSASACTRSMPGFFSESAFSDILKTNIHKTSPAESYLKRFSFVMAALRSRCGHYIFAL